MNPKQKPATSRSWEAWTPTDLAKLQQQFDGSPESVRRLAAEMGRTKDAIRRKAKLLGLSSGRTLRRWTSAECKQLAAYDGTPDSIKAMAQSLGRTEGAIQMKLIHLGKLGGNHSGAPVPAPGPEQRAELFGNRAYADFYINLLENHGREVAEAYLAVTAARRGRCAQPGGLA